ncbi:lipocalin family protein (plasmid) [Novosphingobium sp. BL-8A]|uniref:lipocalin family protein n=1 Tax=Novosphingobium sp. BL-8A TaxID=3127639 RepID=UPI0037574B6F
MSDPNTQVRAVAELDLDRYLGTWFEICRLPLKYEPAKANDITATYSLNEDGTVRVENRLRDEDGKPDRAIGQAQAADASNAKLKVSFLPEYLRWIPFTKGDYWVLAITPDYETALVGTPDRHHLWVLARTPNPHPETVEGMLGTARAMGFDLSKLIWTKQSGEAVPASAFID